MNKYFTNKNSWPCKEIAIKDIYENTFYYISHKLERKFKCILFSIFRSNLINIYYKQTEKCEGKIYYISG